MSIVDVFEECYPDASWEACDELIWLTPYPAGNSETIMARIRELREQYGPNIADAIKGEYAEFDRQCKELSARNQE
jgi:hypothetical protein